MLRPLLYKHLIRSRIWIASLAGDGVQSDAGLGESSALERGTLSPTGGKAAANVILGHVYNPPQRNTHHLVPSDER